MQTLNLSAWRTEYAKRLDESLQAAVETLARLPGIQRVSVFGSYAKGRRDLFTDLDLLVVWDTDKPVTERLASLYPLLDAQVDLDILCYTPREFLELKDAPFLRGVIADEVLLYEKKPA